jgi:hypothetical protein
MKRSSLAFAFSALALMCLNSCQSPNPKMDHASAQTPAAPQASAPRVTSENIPAEDAELAAILDLMAGQGEEPGKVRERFTRHLRDQREKQDRLVRSRRQDFHDQEKKHREAFLKRLEEERAEYQAGSAAKAPHFERQTFFKNLDEKRRVYFSDESQKRDRFEEQSLSERKKFDDHVREQQKKFEQQYSAYTAHYYSNIKSPTAKKDSAVAGPARSAMHPADELLLQEFRNIPRTPAMLLMPWGK